MEILQGKYYKKYLTTDDYRVHINKMLIFVGSRVKNYFILNMLNFTPL